MPTAAATARAAVPKSNLSRASCSGIASCNAGRPCPPRPQPCSKSASRFRGPHRKRDQPWPLPSPSVGPSLSWAASDARPAIAAALSVNLLPCPGQPRRRDRPLPLPCVSWATVSRASRPRRSPNPELFPSANRRARRLERRCPVVGACPGIFVVQAHIWLLGPGGRVLCAGGSPLRRRRGARQWEDAEPGAKPDQRR